MSCFFDCIPEKRVGLIENCGRLSRVSTPGFVCLMWPFENIRAKVSLQIQQLNIVCDTKTRDNVFVQVVIAVLYKVMPEKATEAFYKFTDPTAQIRSYVFDVVRSTLPKMNLDDAFAAKDLVAGDVKKQLTVQLTDCGYEIVASLVTDINPDNRVKSAMNEINASQRLREAAVFKAEAEKILQVKSAEAEAESKYLSGLGVAKQRKAIVDGLRDVVNDFSSHVQGSSAQEVMDLLLLTQYFDVMKEISKKPGNTGNSIFLPHGPNAIKALREDLKSSITSAKKN